MCRLVLYLFLLDLLLTEGSSQPSPEVPADMLNRVLNDYSSFLSQEAIKNIPPHMLREFLKKTVPSMQEHLVKYAQNLHSSVKQDKPEPLLVGFSMGLKGWANRLSEVMSLLKQDDVRPTADGELKDDDDDNDDRFLDDGLEEWTCVGIHWITGGPVEDYFCCTVPNICCTRVI